MSDPRKKALLESAIEHIRAEIGGLQFVQTHRGKKPKIEDLILALYIAVEILEDEAKKL